MESVQTSLKSLQLFLVFLRFWNLEHQVWIEIPPKRSGDDGMESVQTSLKSLQLFLVFLRSWNLEHQVGILQKAFARPTLFREENEVM